MFTNVITRISITNLFTIFSDLVHKSTMSMSSNLPQYCIISASIKCQYTLWYMFTIAIMKHGQWTMKHGPYHGYRSLYLMDTATSDCRSCVTVGGNTVNKWLCCSCDETSPGAKCQQTLESAVIFKEILSLNIYSDFQNYLTICTEKSI